MEEKNNKPRKDFKSKGKFGGKKFGEKKFGGKKFCEKKFGGRGKSFGKDKPDFKKRKLAPGVEFVDRELGVGIVRKLTDEGIVVAFGDAEKLIPRKKREGGYKKDGFKKDGHRKDFKKEAFSAAKPMEKKVFTFDAPLPDAKPPRNAPPPSVLTGYGKATPRRTFWTSLPRSARNGTPMGDFFPDSP